MTFIHMALAVAGLVAIAVPIIIHLLSRRRRKPIEWAAMRFLIEAFQKHKRRLQLEQLILLALRCLALALLGFALARPFLEDNKFVDAGGSRMVFLVIDNGLASGLEDGGGASALSEHVSRAVDVIESLDPSDAVGLITAARPASGLVVPPSTNHGAIVDLLNSLAPSQSATDLPGAIAVLQGALAQAAPDRDRPVVYLFSEFRSGSASLDTPLPPALAEMGEQITLLAQPPADLPAANVQVIAVQPGRSLIIPGAGDGAGQITVRLARTGGELARDVTRVRLTGDSITGAEPKVVTWEAGQDRADVDFMIDPSALRDGLTGISAIIDDDALAADNQRYSILDVREEIDALVVDRPDFGVHDRLDQLSASSWIRQALQPIDAGAIKITLQQPEAIDAADVRQADVAILPRPDLIHDDGWAQLRSMVDRGGLLIVMPPAQTNVHQWTEQLSTTMGLPWRIELEVHDVPEGLALAEEQPASELLRMLSSEMADLVRPVFATRTLPVDMSQTAAEHVLLFADQSPLLILGSPGEAAHADTADQASTANQNQSRGLVMYLAVAPEMSWTSLPVKPLMVPLFQEMVKQGLGMIRASQHYTVGEQPVIAGAAAASELAGPQNTNVPLDAARRPQKPLQQAGHYSVLDPASQAIGKVAVNVDPLAGQTSTQSRAAVAQWLSRSGQWTVFDEDDPTAPLRSASAGLPLAGMILLAVLLLIVTETILARRFSHAYRSSAGAGDQLGGGLSTTLELRPGLSAGIQSQLEGSPA